MTIDVALGDARIKLGQGGYAGLAHASGMVGEGTYKCSDKGLVAFTWERCLEFKDGNWTPGVASKLMPTLSLTEGMFNVLTDWSFRYFHFVTYVIIILPSFRRCCY